MPIFSMPQTHILDATRMLVRSTLAVLAQAQFSGQRVDEAILNGAVQLLERYKYDHFDLGDPHHRSEALQRGIDEAESAQLGMAMFAVGAGMFPAHCRETLAEHLHENIRRFARREDVDDDDARQFFKALLPKLAP